MQESKNSTASPDKKKRILSESRPFYQTSLLEEGLVCEPANITFDSVTPGTLYVMTFSVRNTSKVGQRIRLQHESKTGYFVLNYIPSGTVAPGLDIRGEIECRIPVNTTEYTFSDRIVAIMGNQQLVIPLFASKPYAKIKFNPLLEFSGVVHGHSFHKEVTFENVSDVRGTVKFALPNDSFVKIHPLKFDLDPQGSEDSQKVVKFTVEGKDIGFFREIVKVHIAGALEDTIMDITAQVIEQKLTLIHENNGGLLEVANFGNLFFGEVKTIQALLVNTGPNPLNYLMCYDDEEPGATGGGGGSDDPTTAEDLIYSKALEITPADGNIKGFSSANITITFRPVKIMAEKGFMKQHNEDHKDTRKIERKVYIECREMNQRMLLTMQGSALAPCIVYSPSTLRFGECPVNDRRDIIMTLQNRTKYPTKFEFPIVATFKFSPTKGMIQGMETLTVVATFLPPQLGEFRTVVKLLIAGGLQVLDVRALGESTKSGLKKQLVTGADKLPADFVIAHKYVNPEEEAAARAEKKRLKEQKEWAKEALLRKSLDTSLGLQQTQNTLDPLKTGATGPDTQSEEVVSHASSHERDLIYGFDTASRASSKVHLDKSHPTVTRRLNEQVYNEYLQASHAQRTEAKRVALAKKLMGRGAINHDDPFSVNMGMERGLDEPELKIPHAGEPLWLANNKDGEGAGGASRLPTDENRLIVKKYSSTPATQAELRDCTAELTLDELKIVTASHTLIDFGRVSVGSLSGKNFVVANDLKRCICVTVEDLEPELAKSKALCQVIPQGAIAGFDIYFSCRQIGKFRKSFTWKINGIHSSKVFVVADVVPIEVVMSTQQVTMEFAPDSLAPTLTEEIALTNPGNAAADFLWGSAGAFVCQPDKGSINPGKSQVISITWNPLSGKRNEEELGLHITGGVDQTLKVVGVLKETKAEFADKRILLSVMAVGTEKVVNTSIKNVGTNPLAFFFNHVDEKYGITISPEVGLIPAGESFPIVITITPRSAMNYDNTTLSAKIRGGKQISLKLAGSSTVPQLSLAESGFSFGTVIVGAEHSLPMTLTNRSAIVATLILDMNLYPDFIPRIRDSIEEQSFGAAPTASAEQEDSQGNQITLEAKKDTSQEEEVSARRGKKQPVNNLWKIILMPNCTMSADLVFKPLSAKQFGFRLQLHLQGISEDKSLSRDVSGTSLASVLGVSEMTINFGDRIVSRDPMSRISYFLETTLKNLSSKAGLSYEIREMAEITKEFGKEEVISKPPGPSSLDDASNQIFFISPTKGDLGPNLSTSIRVTFQPQSSGDYSKKLEVYIKGQPDPSRPYLVLNCVGSGVFPRLTFSKQHLELPSVPLSVTSRAQFIIYNNGYNSLDINHRVSPNIPVPLEITYPDGNNIGIMIDKIRVHVAVKSDAPVSWLGKIEFYDQDGERFFVSVSGCSDGCLLTNYPFVRDYSADYGFVGIDDQPVKFLRKTEIAELRAAESKRKEELRKQRSLERQRAVEGKTAVEPPSSPKKGAGGGKDDASVQSKKSRRSSSLMEGSTSSTSGPETALEGIDIEKEESRTSEWDESESLFLLKWLNKNICRRPLDVERFPLCMLDQGGDLAVDCIEQMSGKKVFGKEETSAYPSKRNSDVNLVVEDSNKRNSEKNQKITAANKLVFKLQQVLNMLISSGALLAHVNPICMLALEDHLLAQEFELTKDKSIRFTPAMLAERRKSWEDSWARNCRHSWMEVLYQSVKIYVLSRLNYASYTKMPGVILSDGKDLAPPAAPPKKAAAPGPPAAAPKVKKAPAFPKDFQPSNVFSHGEAVLLAWATYHLDHAGNMIDEGATAAQMDAKLINFNKRVFDLNADFGDVFGFCQLIHSHVTDITAENEPLSGYTTIDRSHRDDLTAALHDAMVYLKMELGLTVQDLASSTRNILLMLLHFFLNLPSLIPKTKIEFSGELGSPIVKTIELKNPSSKKIVYQITLRGSSDFSIDSTELIIPPESTVEYPVNLNARFFEPVLAKLTFWGVKDSGQAGSTMCFQLISSITGRKPYEKITRKSNLFEMETFALQVRNPFGKDGTYSVKLQVSHVPLSVEDYVKGNTSTKGMKPPALRERISPDTHLNDAERKQYEQDLEIEGAFTNPFWTNEENVVLTKTGTKSLYVYMLPFMIGRYTCQVVFIEKETGEFCYQLNGEVGLPKAYDRLEFSSLQGQGTNVAIRVAAKNTGFEKAFGILTEARIKQPAKKIKARTLFQNIFSSPVANEETGQCNYLIDFLHPYFNWQKKLALVSEYLKMKSTPGAPMLVKEIKTGSTTAVQKNFKKVLKTLIEPPTAEDLAVQGGAVLNSVILQFTAPKAGVYQNTAIVYGRDNPYDIRVIDVTATAGVPDSKMTLEFKGAARQRIVQDIPVTNESAKDWVLAVTCTGKGFSAPKLLNVPKGGAPTLLEVVFQASFAGTFDGHLVLKNPENNDTFQYTLIGVADDPLADDNLHFSCAARKKKSCTIMLNQIPTPPPVAVKGSAIVPRKEYQTFEVETDLPYVTSAATVDVPAEGKKFEFFVQSPMGGTFQGSMTFRDVESGAIIWYTVTIEVTSPLEERSIDVEAVVRKAVVVDITLSNPSEDPLLFDVYFQGDGLIGDSMFELAPKNTPGSNDTYELIYSPLLTGSFVGRISFTNDRVGELWYKLNLTALPAPPIVCDTIESMVGTSQSVTVPLDNPLAEAVTFNVEIEDPEHFFLANEKVTLGPYAQSSFSIHFRPDSLNETVQSTVRLFNEKFGEIVYVVSGVGLLPGNMAPVTIETPLGELGSESIQFRNPFAHPLPMDVVLSITDTSSSSKVTNGKKFSAPAAPAAAAEPPKPAFALLLKRTTDLVVPPKTLFQIAVSFNPLTLGAYQATLQIRSTINGRSLLWCYPIVGIAEAGSALRLPLIKTPCKTSLMKEVEIPLEGIRKADIPGVEDFSMADFSIESKIDDKVKGMVTRAFRVQAVEAVALPEDEPNTFYMKGKSRIDYALKCRLLFEPLRTFQTRIEVVIVYRNRGKWRVIVDLEAADPEPDDRIKLVAPVGGQDKVTFKLNNRFLGFSNFQAYFSAKSSPHFHVTPTSGVLAPFGAEGSQFVVQFHPVEYGIIEVGTLVIQTEDTQWNYEVRGSYPDASINTAAIRSKVDCYRGNNNTAGGLTISVPK